MYIVMQGSSGAPAPAPQCGGKRGAEMQVVVWKSPKCLSGILRAIFKIKKS
ncbi:stage V sporulation protein SpoVM [Subdoligranulum sp. AM23-21AC]|uniref:Stage V sporulation protein SpoVM n=2 Tax=Ruthenibacterium lactatiformans TaxID=1550024 RepID=A0A6I2U865_9FIRM|nr:stage V sporulation protein SpoVM [Ruthenibacterium lactatiformans]RGC97952.1 stage V sporulation protein SpoVM [Subdoligranulum sp. AM16-9]RGD19777.1 stage V sporulation protein SpoVM [Subdoligranulum sp. AM23-21AC]RJV98968.1 stage V sporulation protein SpoVM [Subdoligranulum sp. AF14-43]RJW29025.1 stage V sporulation protein SpoVM [Subdoligranulum sp. TF05-17AC]RJW80860.1 stage V sporulation protein SpoVM [Subdoligranulum sp. OF01-18]